MIVYIFAVCIQLAISLKMKKKLLVFMRKLGKLELNDAEEFLLMFQTKLEFSPFCFTFTNTLM